MDIFNRNLITLKRLGTLFFILGVIETFSFYFLTGAFLLMVPGLITLLATFFFLALKKYKWGYIVGIWALFKYNPLMIAFLLGDFFKANRGFVFNLKTTSIFVFVLLFAAISCLLGIIIIVYTSRHFRLLNKQK